MSSQVAKVYRITYAKWYIERHDNEQLLQDILDLDKDKQDQRKPKNS